MPVQNIEIGDVVPISLVTADGAINQYPQAEVRDNDNNLLTTLNLAHIASGSYKPSTPYIMPDEVYLLVIYIVYSDSGHTTENTTYERDLEVFYKVLRSGDWTSSEKEQIRDSLGIDGTKTASSGGLIQRIKTLIDLIFVNTA